LIEILLILYLREQKMITNSYKFSKKLSYRNFKAHTVLDLTDYDTPCVLLTATLISGLLGQNTWELVLDKMTPNNWFVNMKAKITDSDFFNGEFTIVSVNEAEKKLRILIPYVITPDIYNGNVVPYGTVDLNITKSGTALFNNTGQQIAEVYTGNNSFLYENYQDQDVHLEIINSGEQALTYSVSQSLDGYTWIAVANQQNKTISAGNNAQILFDRKSYYQLYRIDITDINGTTYYINGG